MPSDQHERKIEIALRDDVVDMDLAAIESAPIHAVDELALKMHAQLGYRIANQGGE
ncbi:MAG: hypothetical protein GY701_34270 [Sulfitobacter sp.]|nr:hypothetical protein [Sulfitobacter sp.]